MLTNGIPPDFRGDVHLFIVVKHWINTLEIKLVTHRGGFVDNFFGKIYIDRSK